MLMEISASPALRIKPPKKLDRLRDNLPRLKLKSRAIYIVFHPPSDDDLHRPGRNQSRQLSEPGIIMPAPVVFMDKTHPTCDSPIRLRFPNLDLHGRHLRHPKLHISLLQDLDFDGLFEWSGKITDLRLINPRLKPGFKAAFAAALHGRDPLLLSAIFPAEDDFRSAYLFPGVVQDQSRHRAPGQFFAPKCGRLKAN